MGEYCSTDINTKKHSPFLLKTLLIRLTHCMISFLTGLFVIPRVLTTLWHSLFDWMSHPRDNKGAITRIGSDGKIAAIEGQGGKNSGKGAMKKSTVAKSGSNYEHQKKQQKKAFESLSQALEIDENGGDKRQAIFWYKAGIEDLERGVAIRVTGQGPDRDAADRLHEKMQRNLTMSRDRVTVLKRELGEGSSSGATAAAGRSGVGRGASGKKAVAKDVRKEGANRRVLSTPSPSPASADAKLDAVKQKLKGKAEPAMVELILNDIIDTKQRTTFQDIVGQDLAKRALQEAVILPSLRPELFTGLRSPVRGILLFGPPGNGKTLLAKAVASESNSTFFNLSASSLTSKWFGESEKIVRALFACAREMMPAVIFLDEIDSILSARRTDDNEASRRLKTEFLIQFDGVQSKTDERVLVMAATNRPQELDEAALRRFPKRIYARLPDYEMRKFLLKALLDKQKNPLRDRDLDSIARQTEGYSCSDITALAKEAAMGPIRELAMDEIKSVSASQVRPIVLKDFDDALRHIRPSVDGQSVQFFDNWNVQHGDIGAE